MTGAPAPSQEERSVPDRAQLEAAACTLLKLLDQSNQTVTTAESCTGGFLASLLTDIEGLSHCLDRGYVCYSKTAKQDMLGIDSQLIEECGAVSEAVTQEMARNSQILADSGISIAITGFAGPSGPEVSEEAGVSYIGVAVPHQSWVYRVDYGPRPRREVRSMATLAALAIGIRTLTDQVPD